MRSGDRWQLAQANEVILEWNQSKFPKAADWFLWQLKLATLVRQQGNREEQQADESEDMRSRTASANMSTALATIWTTRSVSASRRDGTPVRRLPIGARNSEYIRNPFADTSGNILKVLRDSGR
jgi:hypothetical protein